MFHYTHHCCYCITRPSINVTSVVSSSTHHYHHPYKFMLSIPDHIIRILCMTNIPITYYWQLFHSTSFHYIIIALLSLLLLLSFVPSVHLWPKITHDCLSRSEEPSFAYRHYRHLINTISYSVFGDNKLSRPRSTYTAPPLLLLFHLPSLAVIWSVLWMMSDDMGFFHGISSMLWVIWGYSTSLLN